MPPTLFRRSLMVLALLALAACGASVPGSGLGPDATREGPVRVALLAPLGSTDADRERLGQSLVNAARLAADDLQGVDLVLSVHATAGEPEVAARAVQTALAEGADVILGPLFASATEVVGPVAAGAGLTVLSLSNTPSVAGGNVYTLGTTFEVTADRVVRYAVGTGAQDIGIVHPDGAEGLLARRAVERAAAGAGARIVAVSRYPLSVQGITETGRTIASEQRAAAADVIVLTDGPTGGLTFVAETLRGLGVRAETSRFLGLQRWDVSPQALAQPGLSGGWFAAPDAALLAQFERRYRGRYGAAPHPLAGLAYDGVAAIGALAAEAEAEGQRDPFGPARLTQPQGFAGVLGIFRFNAANRVERGLAVYEVIDGRAEQIEPAPRSFEPRGS